MSLRLRFLLCLLAVLVLMGAPALYAASRVMELRDMVLELRGQAAQSALAVGRLDAALGQVDHYQRVYVASPDAEAAALMHAGARDVAMAVATLRAGGYGDLVARSGIRTERLAASTAQLQALVQQGRLDEATAYLVTEAAPLLEGARAAIPGLAAVVDLDMSARVPVAQRTAVTAGTATMAAVLVGVLLAMALAVAAARVLTDPLDRLRRSMARVAEGTFETPFDLPYDRDDEVGELSRSFRTMSRRLGELDRLKAEFVGTISHDLKTPISVVAGYAELLQDELGDSADGRRVEMLRTLSEQTRTLQRRVDQLLEISRMDSGRLQLGLEEIDLRHFAEELHREFEPQARMRDIRLELTVHEATPARLVADPDVLRLDVLGNLLGNALKFTPPGGVVCIGVQPEGEAVCIEVADTGVGIPQDQLERIFDRYYQARVASGGLGLGLAIARAGVASHGGRIDVQSRVGRGTRFRVTLPLSARAAAAPPPAQPVLRAS